MGPQSIPLHLQISELREKLQKLEEDKTQTHKIMQLQEVWEVKHRALQDEIQGALTDVASLQFEVLCLETRLPPAARV
mgnify:FL=1|jgi:hypothetical protein